MTGGGHRITFDYVHIEITKMTDSAAMFILQINITCDCGYTYYAGKVSAAAMWAKQHFEGAIR